MKHKILPKVALFAAGVATGLAIKDLVKFSFEKGEFEEEGVEEPEDDQVCDQD